MSLRLVAAFVLARAEAGELPANPKAQRKKIVTTRELHFLNLALAKWSLNQTLAATVELFFGANLLIEDEKGFLRPTPAAYSWLQLPPALAYRQLAETLPLPLPAELVNKLLGSGVPVNSSDQALLLSLEALDLVVEQASMVFAQPQAHYLLQLLTFSGFAKTNPSEDALLTLATAWQQTFPGKSPDKGWLVWLAEFDCFAFANGQPFAPPTFDAWQLFRLFSLTALISADENYYYLAPSQNAVSETALRGVNPQTIQAWLKAGLAGPLPSNLASTLTVWLSQSYSLRTSRQIVLEVQDRAIMQFLLTDYQLRRSIATILSPRHALVKADQLTLLQRKLANRGFHLHLDATLQPPTNHLAATTFTLLRPQLQTLVTALLGWRQVNVSQGYPVTNLDLLLDNLKPLLTLREQQEAAEIATRARNSKANVTEITDIYYYTKDTPVEAALWDAIANEREVLIEYAVPNEAPQERWVLPLVVFNNDEVGYLQAFCQLRQAERLFRLDRLRLIGTRR